MPDLLLAIDSGTTSTRALAFDLGGQVVDVVQHPLGATFPQSGWVEQDAAAIWHQTRDAVSQLLARANGRVVAVGLANQRETVVLWSRRTGEPLAPAIVWQDRRGSELCARLRAAGHEAAVQAQSGLLLDPYFSASKIRWALANLPAVAGAAARGDLAIGTIDSWLLYKFAGVHRTDASNAARTLLMDLRHQRWAPELLDLFGVPAAALPEICGTTGAIAELAIAGQRLPLTGMAGDQQAALIGQGCIHPGLAKCTYGTGMFLLANSGPTPPVSHNRLLSTILGTAPASYALEGSVFVAGDAIKWLRDALGLLRESAQSEALARSVADTGGVTFVPAFAGLGAPYWNADVRGTLVGLTSGTTAAHIVRATLEAMSLQTVDLLEAFRADGIHPTTLRVDGGMAANNWLCQDIADMTAIPVERPRSVETTALGAAMLAGVGAGLFADLAEATRAMVHTDRRFEPSAAAWRQQRLARWRTAIAQALAGTNPPPAR